MIIHLRRWLGDPIPNVSLAMFFDGVSVMLRSGRSVSEALMNQASYGADPELRSICASAAPKVRNGASLSACLRPYERRFPEIVICLLEVGEVSGGLADAAQRLADTLNQTIAAERRFKFGVYDPRLFLLAFALILFIRGVIAGGPQPGQSLVSAGIAIVANVLLTVALVIVAFFAARGVFRVLYRWRALRMAVDTVKLALPRVGAVSRNLSAARWARSFATLWGAGVNISTALEVSAGSALNAHYERALRIAALQTRQGRSLSQCLAHTQMLPAHLLSVIAICETAGRLDDNLMRLATEMEREALERAIEEMNKFVVAAQVIVIIAAVAASL